MKIKYSTQELKNAGVYSIVHLESGKRYVGSTKSFHYRMLWHRATLNKGTHDNKVLQEAWNLYGKEAFSFEILETVLDKDLRIQREQYWMDFYNSVKEGFNMGTSAVNPMLGNTHTPEAKEKIRQKALGRKGNSFTEEQKLKIKKSVTNKSKSNRVRSLSESEKALIYEENLTEEFLEQYKGIIYYLTSPEGVEYKTINLANFCRVHLLYPNRLSKLIFKGKFYKGWSGYWKYSQ